MYLRLEGDRIADISFVGSGCAISKASASMMTDSVKGLTVGEAEALFAEFHAMLTSGDANAAPPASIGKLAVFAGVAELPGAREVRDAGVAHPRRRVAHAVRHRHH